MSAFEPQSPLDRHMRAGRFGAAGGSPVQIARRSLAVAQVMARKGQGASVSAKIENVVGVRLPEPGRSASAGEVTAVWIGPEAWLVLRPWSAQVDLAQDLAGACGASASVVDQSAGKSVLRVSGAKARDVLAKGCRVDLHPRVFRAGRAAVTPIAHVHAIVQQVDETPTFDLLVPATLAEDFFGWLCLSAAEFGYEVQA